MSSESVSVVVERAIDQAFQFAEEKKYGAAVNAFALARACAVELTPPLSIRRLLKHNQDSLKAEREACRSKINSRGKGIFGWGKRPYKLLIMSDSLGLPRNDPDNRDSETYASLLTGLLEQHIVDSIAQRYFTTEQVFDLMTQNPELGAQSDVVVHVGLNDCADRLFLEKERLAVSLLPEPVLSKVLAFGRQFRGQVMLHSPPRNYVPLDKFRENLNSIIALLKARGARTIIVGNIILPPIRFWEKMPARNENFLAYNLEILRAARRHRVQLLDVDRYVWRSIPAKAEDGTGPLLADGMHLSDSGHAIVAERIAQIILHRMDASKP